MDVIVAGGVRRRSPGEPPGEAGGRMGAWADGTLGGGMEKWTVVLWGAREDGQMEGSEGSGERGAEDRRAASWERREEGT